MPSRGKRGSSEVAEGTETGEVAEDAVIAVKKGVIFGEKGS